MQALTPLAFVPPCLPLFGHCVCLGLPPLWRHPLSHPSSVALLCHLYLVFAHCLLRLWLIPPPWQNVPVAPGPVAHPTTHADNVSKVKLFYSRIGRCAIEHVVSHPNKSNFQSLFFHLWKGSVAKWTMFIPCFKIGFNYKRQIYTFVKWNVFSERTCCASRVNTFQQMDI